MLYKPSTLQLNNLRHLSHPRYRGCVAHWLLNDGNGLNATDISGFRLTGVLTNIATSAWVSGPYGYALSFDGGSGDRVQTAETNFITNHNQLHSAFAWVYRIGNNVNQAIWSFGEFDDTDFGTALGVNTSNALCWLPNGYSTRVHSSGITVPLNAWAFVGFVRDTTSNVTIYVNGAKAAVSATDNETVGSDPHLLGRTMVNAAQSGSVWNGYIDNVRVYKRALKPDEVASLYANPFLEFKSFRRLVVNAAAAAGQPRLLRDFGIPTSGRGRMGAGWN